MSDSAAENVAAEPVAVAEPAAEVAAASPAAPAPQVEEAAPKLDAGGDVAVASSEAADNIPPSDVEAVKAEEPKADENMEVDEPKAEAEKAEEKVEDAKVAAATPKEETKVTNDVATIEQAVKTGDAPAASIPVLAEKKDNTPKKPKADLSKAPVRQYLDVTVVPYLLKGLSNLARERPANPLEYLGQFLIEKAKEEAANPSVE